MKNTATNKVKQFPQFFTLGLQTTFEQKGRRFLSWSTISTRLDIYVFKWNDTIICKSLVQPICMVIMKYLIA